MDVFSNLGANQGLLIFIGGFLTENGFAVFFLFFLQSANIFDWKVVWSSSLLNPLSLLVFCLMDFCIFKSLQTLWIFVEGFLTEKRCAILFLQILWVCSIVKVPQNWFPLSQTNLHPKKFCVFNSTIQQYMMVNYPIS